MKVASMSKQFDLMRITDCPERPNLYYVIEIGCIFNKSAKEKILFLSLELKCITLNSPENKLCKLAQHPT